MQKKQGFIESLTSKREGVELHQTEVEKGWAGFESVNKRPLLKDRTCRKAAVWDAFKKQESSWTCISCSWEGVGTRYRERSCLWNVVDLFHWKEHYVLVIRRKKHEWTWHPKKERDKRGNRKGEIQHQKATKLWQWISNCVLGHTMDSLGEFNGGSWRSNSRQAFLKYSLAYYYQPSSIMQSYRGLFSCTHSS